MCSILRWLNPLPHCPDFNDAVKKKAFKSIVGKEENAGDPAFSSFPTMSSTHPILLRETIQTAFFSKLWPFFYFDFLSSIKHATAQKLAPACSAPLLQGH